MSSISTVNMTHADWLRERQKGIGGSDAPALMMTPDDYKWMRPKDVYMSKVGEIDEEENLPCRLGHYLEPFIADLFTEMTGLRVHCHNRIIVSDKYPFMRANIDRKLYGANIGLEIKSTSAFNASKFDDDTYPYNYYFQMQHYMAVTGWEKWYLAALIGNNHFAWYEVPRDEECIEALIETESKFWNDIVVPRNMEELEKWV